MRSIILFLSCILISNLSNATPEEYAPLKAIYNSANVISKARVFELTANHEECGYFDVLGKPDIIYIEVYNLT